MFSLGLPRAYSSFPLSLLLSASLSRSSSRSHFDKLTNLKAVTAGVAAAVPVAAAAAVATAAKWQVDVFVWHIAWGKLEGEQARGQVLRRRWHRKRFAGQAPRTFFGLLPGDLIVRWQICMGNSWTRFVFVPFLHLSHIFEGLRVDSMPKRNSRLQSASSY